MGSIWQVINEWEIQLLVLLSFTIQVFLFFTGSLRRCSSNGLLRGTIWLAYLGADMVAVYALGLISRKEDSNMGGDTSMRTHSLAFFWAPFLIFHLGGQDTITSFSIEDNNLWLRHLLNLVIQTTLALYVFWKSTTISRNVQLLVPGTFMLVAGIIKYAERIMALRHGSLYNTSSAVNSNSSFNEKISKLGHQDGYCSVISHALRRASGIQMLFARRMTYEIDNNLERPPSTDFIFDADTANKFNDRQLSKLLDIELGMVMYNDLYTKSALLRKRSGIALRCISQLSAVVALVVFFVANKQAGRYGRADIAITYTLFVGGFLLDVCAVIKMFIVSPWTWGWLESQGYKKLAYMSKSLLCSKIFGWPETRPLWSGAMGQYSILSYIGFGKPVGLSQRVMSTIRKMGRVFGIEEAKKLFWISKLLDTTNEKVDDRIIGFLVEDIPRIKDGGDQWQCWGPILKGILRLKMDFVGSISLLHLITEIYLNEVSSASSVDDSALVDVCRKLSGYLFYIVTAHPAAASMLQVVSGSPEAALENIRQTFLKVTGSTKDDILRAAKDELAKNEIDLPSIEQNKQETLEELKNMWVRLLIYSAGRSRPEVHAAHLARGGELLTFVWLLMAHHDLGDCMRRRVNSATAPKELCAFNL